VCECSSVTECANRKSALWVYLFQLLKGTSLSMDLLHCAWLHHSSFRPELLKHYFLCIIPAKIMACELNDSCTIYSFPLQLQFDRVVIQLRLLKIWFKSCQHFFDVYAVAFISLLLIIVICQLFSFYWFMPYYSNLLLLPYSFIILLFVCSGWDLSFVFYVVYH